MSESSFRKYLPKYYVLPRCATDICSGCFIGKQLFNTLCHEHQEYLSSIESLSDSEESKELQKMINESPRGLLYYLSYLIYNTDTHLNQLLKLSQNINKLSLNHQIEQQSKEQLTAWLKHKIHVVKRKRDQKNQKDHLKYGQVSPCTFY